MESTRDKKKKLVKCTFVENLTKNKVNEDDSHNRAQGIPPRTYRKCYSPLRESLEYKESTLLRARARQRGLSTNDYFSQE